MLQLRSVPVTRRSRDSDPFVKSPLALGAARLRSEPGGTARRGRAREREPSGRPRCRSRFPSPPSFQRLRGCALGRDSVASSNHTTAICSLGRRCWYRCLLVHLGVEHQTQGVALVDISPCLGPHLQYPQLRPVARFEVLALPLPQTIGAARSTHCQALRGSAPEPQR